MERPIPDDVAAFVLTGGASERMGTDKALLRLPSGETLLEHALALGASVASEVYTVGPRERYASFAWAGSVIEDALPGHGPLGGIQTALKASRREWNVILAVDTPLITSELLRWLIGEAKRSGAVVTVPRVGARRQTLCGVYRREFEPLALRALEANRNKIDPLYNDVKTQVLDEPELLAAGFGPELFGNCNTPEELSKLFATT